MTEMMYVVTADVLYFEEDGRDSQDGSVIRRTFPMRETWTFPASTPIGKIMEAVNERHSPYNITITEDNVTAATIREERLAAAKAKRGTDDSY